MTEQPTYEDRRISFGAGQGSGNGSSDDSSGGSGGVPAAEYDAVRPDWPVQTMSWLLGEPPAGVRLHVVDLGAGTGKGTRALAAMGHAVVAVEPSAGMREVLSASLETLPPEAAGWVEVRAGDAERLPLPDAGVDVVVVLQAWHWFDQDAAEHECARVLRPGGLLSMAWHQRDESPAWARDLSEAVHRSTHVPHVARVEDGAAGGPGQGSADEDPPQGEEDAPQDHRDDDELPLTSGAFDPVETTVLTWTMQQSVEDVVRQAATWSYVAVSPQRASLLARVREVAQGAADSTGTVHMPMTTSCYRARRR